MIRTRIAQAAAVASLALGTVILLPSAAVAAPATTAASAQTAPAPITQTVAPNDLTWG
ncbi:hypothetical protein [Streptacidiphilus jiangxiensis]|uniref:Uncharacterized protein n=1 Tax=Streptacidiphilus jiangxiensis TaxID=235985 RepID=A0A1H8ADK9_STRJI|nr:hypothetical protein [Streptacidiphilus jiangxiensis]SEM68810.1 hypothetical protein SAMN05414137_1443 [Streptacidiphilus jiangxiensis]